MDLGRLRLRLSLWCRSLVALGVVGTFTLAVSVVVSVIVIIGGVGVIFVSAIGVDYLGSAPQLSALVPVSPVAVSVAGLLALGVLIGVRSAVLSDSSHRHAGRLTAVVVVLSIGCLYVVAVEASVVLTRLFNASTVPVLRVMGLALVVYTILSVWWYVRTARREVGQLRDQLVADSEPAAETRPALAEAISRLAQQVGVPSPTLRITDVDHPESFTVGHGSEAVIVVSTGLCEALSTAELTAVLAHEVSHLANADSRIMDAVLVPVLMADELIEEPRDLGDKLWNVWFRLLKRYGQFGVAILSRGREWSADAGAVALTGSPAALASALATLSETRQTPSTDLRNWEQSVGALDILPPADREQATGPFRTHPSTEKRIDRLRQQVVAAERTSV